MSTIRPPHFNIIIIYENERIINHKRLKIIKFIQKYIQKHSFLLEMNFPEFHDLFFYENILSCSTKKPPCQDDRGGIIFY
ncbi:hypothetical protein CN563_20635 [Bacillus sp. AFS026049]|nr:hypothetical protein CON84_12985 [Bacillus sp. AFS094228]PEO44146.1 hypothetical protein CN563_20635 [Bacillus sp. AFS026049]